MTDPARILVRLPNWVGDVAMATPVLRALRRRYPEARIVWLLREPLEAVVRCAPWADALAFETKGGLRALARTAHALRRERFDLALVLPNSFRTALVAALSGARTRIGFDGRGRRAFLTRPLRAPRRRFRVVPRPTPHFYREIAQAVDVTVGDLKPVLPFDEGALGEVARRLAAEGVKETDLLFGFSPGASFGASKLWNPARFAAVADALAGRHGARGVLLTSPRERPIGDAIARDARVPLVRVEAWIDLHRLKPLAARLSLLVTTDAGPRHYGAAFDVPTVALLGPNRPEWTAETLGRTEVVRIDVPCGPCHLPRCPLDRWCMEGIETEQVLEAAERLLALHPPAPRNPARWLGVT